MRDRRNPYLSSQSLMCSSDQRRQRRKIINNVNVELLNNFNCFGNGHERMAGEGDVSDALVVDLQRMQQVLQTD